MVNRRPTAQRRARRLSLLAMLVVGLVGCASDDGPVTATKTQTVQGKVIVDGLVGPTQIVVAPSGDLWVAQLNGGENDAVGQVVVIDHDRLDDPPSVVLDGLDKPTGLAIFDDQLWVMERNRLTRGPIDGTADSRSVVADDLPTNGRSEGSLTVDGDRVLFDTSGSVRDGEVVPESGVLWSVDGDGNVEPVATGFKHAYAQVRLPSGELLTTEISDGSYDGSPPDDELVAVEPGADHGWPRCVGDNRPVAQYDGTAEICDGVPRSYAVFAPRATPTSVVVAPWDDTVLLVALWNEGRVVGVTGSGPTAKVNDVYTDAEHPQHLVVDGDRVLLTDHTAGTIIELTAGS